MRTKICDSCIDDCSNEQFMVHDSLWEVICENFNNRPKYICVTCAEQLINRRLNPLDFIFCPLNYDIQYYRSKKLINRLTRFED